MEFTESIKKKNEIMTPIGKQMQMEIVMLNKISQIWVREMVLCVKVLAAKPNNLRSVTFNPQEIERGTVAAENWLPLVVLLPPTVTMTLHTHRQT